MRDYTHKIEDVKEFFNNYDNSIELKIEDLDRLKEIMLKKQKELTDAGKEFINLHLFLVGFDEYDDEQYFMTRLCWDEKK